MFTEREVVSVEFTTRAIYLDRHLMLKLRDRFFSKRRIIRSGSESIMLKALFIHKSFQSPDQIEKFYLIVNCQFIFNLFNLFKQLLLSFILIGLLLYRYSVIYHLEI